MTTNNLLLFKIFLRCGLLSIGNGYAAIEPLRRRIVTPQSQLSDEAFNEALSIVNAMPGVFSINLGAYLGHKLGGWQGATAAVAGTLLPPMAAMLIVAFFWKDLHDCAALSSFLKGIRPAIVALLVAPLIHTARSARITLSTVWLPVGAALGICLLGISPVYIVGGVLMLGILYGLFVHPTES